MARSLRKFCEMMFHVKPQRPSPPKTSYPCNKNYGHGPSRFYSSNISRGVARVMQSVSIPTVPHSQSNLARRRSESDRANYPGLSSEFDRYPIGSELPPGRHWRGESHLSARYAETAAAAVLSHHCNSSSPSFPNWSQARSSSPSSPSSANAADQPSRSRLLTGVIMMRPS